MKKLLLYFFLCFFYTSLLAQKNIIIQVISFLPNDTTSVYITGNNDQLGNWNPSKIKLNKINDSTLSRSFTFVNGQDIEFKFTLGSWNSEALKYDQSPFANNLLTVKNDTIINFNIKKWGSGKTTFQGKITGNVKYHKNFEARRVLSRDIVVWLPPSYNSLPDKFYPVLYMQDGQNLFDPVTSSFGKDWQIDETVDSLIKANVIQEIIIVGIYNSINRGKEYNHTELGEDYIQFLVEELKPFIDKTYRTLPDRKNTAIGGSSSGGLISFIGVWEFDCVFSKSVCISPAFKIADIDYVTPVENYTGVKKDIKIYIDNGGIGLERQLQPGVDEMLRALENKGFKEGNDLLFFKDSKAEHNESAWAKRVYRFLEFLFPNY